MSNLTLDLTGSASANAVSEMQALELVSGGSYNYVIAKKGPFFLDSLVVKATLTEKSDVSGYTVNSTVTLTKWVDYIPVLHFIEATTACGKGIYAGILIPDLSALGYLTISYQALGGTYQVDTTAASALIAAQTVNPVSTDYCTAFSLDASFDATTLEFNEREMVTLADLVTSLGTLATVLTSAGAVYTPMDFRTHIADYDNPHALTATMLSLENVPNWRTATTAQAQAGVATNLFVTPKGAAAAAGSKASVPHATETSEGTVELNLGQSSGDDTDDEKVLTTAGLLAMKTSGTTNAIKAIFTTKRQQVYFHPLPVPYPVYCLGVLCVNFSELLSAVETNMSLTGIQGSASQGCVWLPYDATTPDLLVTPADDGSLK